MEAVLRVAWEWSTDVSEVRTASFSESKSKSNLHGLCLYPNMVAVGNAVWEKITDVSEEHFA